MKTRNPAVAGQFYPGSEPEIINTIKGIQAKEKIDISYSTKNIIGAIVPHAGYIFSGYHAIHFFELLKNTSVQYDTFFIINPSHSGYGSNLALDENDNWETPLGKVAIDKAFYPQLNLPLSALAHQYEHSGEVMLPFLQYLLPYTFKIVPIAMKRQSTENAKTLANTIYNANKTLNKNIMIIASSDFSHYVKPSDGERLDNMVVDCIEKLDSESVYNTVMKNDISVCGFGPIMTLIEYARLVCDAPKTTILRRGHSGENMPTNEVVDYITMLFYDEDMQTN